ncbi:MAG: GmrSD restriction endonuclease domain-containing protein [Thermoguttaceae bacterium]
MAQFKTNDTDISEILQNISKGTIQLPEFQRDWTWDDERIRGLIGSVIDSYPVGALTFMQFGGDAKFKYRVIAGCAEVPKDKKPESLILDGQQRLTALYNVLLSKKATQTKTEKNKKIERFYYLDIEKFLDHNCDTTEAIISVPENRIIRENIGNRDIILDVSSREKEFERHLLPLNLVFDSDGFREWERGYQSFHNNQKDILSQLDQVYKKVIQILLGYKVPVITLTKEVSKAAVCQVFEKVNTGGVTLTMFELVVASFAADEVDLRKEWQLHYSTMSKDIPILSDFEEKSENFLIAVILFSRHKKNPKLSTFKRKDILELSVDDFKQNAESIVVGFRKAANFLREERIFTPKELPYIGQLIPLAVLFAILGKRMEDKVVKDKLSHWLWCGIFGELYGTSSESRFAKDITGFLDWINGGDAPDTVRQAIFSPTRLLELRTRTNVPYKGITALILKNGAKDFVSGSKIDETWYTNDNVDIHHIFPKAWCKDRIQETKWDSVINKTPLSSRSNREIIRGDAPSKYIGRIVAGGHVKSDMEINELLATHLIDIKSMRVDDFDVFFIKRAKSLLDLIGKAMGKAITGLDSQEVIEEYGESLV